MNDIHTHILYGIDDGSKSYEESVKLLKEMEELGIKNIVLTPHYIIGTNYNSSNKEKKQLLEKLQKNTNIKLYLGNETFIDNDILAYIDKKFISTINNTKYLLMEFPLNERSNYMYDIIFNLKDKGITPIIAHPERYRYLKIEDFIKLIDMGCLFQMNITSLIDKYGKRVRKNALLLVKKHMVHVIGTDTHNHVLDINKGLSILRHMVDYDMYNDIVYENFNKIISNKKVEPYEIIKTNKLFAREKIK